MKFGKIRCKSCLEEKLPEDFYPNKTYASGITSKCKVCLRKATKHYVSLKPDKYIINYINHNELKKQII